jgi:hypothetical protein
VSTVVRQSYSFFNVSSVRIVNNSNLASISVFSNYSYLSQLCLTTIVYFDSLASTYNLYYANYKIGLLFNSSQANATFAQQASVNFNINSLFGPTYAAKCLIGFSGFQLNVGTRQTISFNFSGAAPSQLQYNG